MKSLIAITLAMLLAFLVPFGLHGAWMPMLGCVLLGYLMRLAVDRARQA